MPFTIQVRGQFLDLNSDSSFTEADLASFAQSLAALRSNPSMAYDSRLDLNGDGLINRQDFVMLLDAFLQIGTQAKRGPAWPQQLRRPAPLRLWPPMRPQWLR